MKNEKGITLVILTITIIVMMILAGIAVHYSRDLIRNAKLQDLKTNMLLIQAKAKECVEEVSFQTANINDGSTIEQIKSTNYKGTPLVGSGIEEEAKATGKIEDAKINEYYYFTLEDLKSIGITELLPEDYGYFIVRYNLEKISVDVINTKGYKGAYDIQEIISISEE